MTNPVVTPQTTTTPLQSQQVIEQYKAKLSDLGNVGTRQSSAMVYYISIVSALFGLLAFKEKSLFQIDAVILLMVCGVGFLICLLWLESLEFFRALFRAKLQVIEEIEESLPFQSFHKEFELLRKSRSTSWVWIERFIPAVFALFFLGIICTRLARF